MTIRKQIYRYGVLATAVFALCLILPQAAMAATGQVNYNTTYQQLDGFGGAAVYDVTTLISHDDREDVYDLLFKELGIDILRIRNTYGYDDGGDNLSATGTIVAEARESQRSPNLKLELVPWSPAGYLKSNGDENSGGTLAGGPSNYVYDDYADWWADSLTDTNDGWPSVGIYPDFISIQNEPDVSTSYDSCRFDATENSSVAGYDQAFEAVYDEVYSRMTSSTPQFWAPCTMGFGNSEAYIDALVNRGQINNVAGFSHHLYTDGSYDYPDGMISGMQNYKTYYGDYYGKTMHMTEYVKLDTTPNFDMGLKFAWHIYNCLYYEGVSSFFNWTLFRGTSSQGGIVTLTTSGYIIRPQYWFLKGYSHFTDEGWYLVDTSVDGTGASNLRIAAFKSPDNTQLTIVITNISTSSTSLTLSVNGFSPDTSEVYRSSETENWVSLGTYNPSMTLPAESITTISLLITGPQQTLSTSSTTGGSVIIPGEGIFNYPQDSNATIEAEADSYYHFTIWSGSAVTAGKVADPCALSTTVFMDANYAVVANFEADPPDLDPPDPSPMTWELEPAAIGSSSITMRATTADDNSLPVEYYFECTTDGDANSTWQTDPNYTATGLNPSTSYTFRVKARDSYLTPNVTGWSSSESATTQAAPTDVEILGDWATGLSHAEEAGYSRALIFIAHAEHASPVTLSSVTYGGQPMTLIIDESVGTGYSANVTAFILDDAGIAATTSSTFAPSWSATPENVGYISVFLGSVDQTDPVGDNDSNSTASSTPNPITTTALNTDDGDMVFVGATCGNSGDYTVNNSFTEAYEHDMGSSTGTDGYKAATGVPETPSVTHTSVNRQVIIGFVLNAMESIIPDDPPAAPTNLAADAGNETVSLDWDDNNETDLAGYNVYRSETSGGGSGYDQINVSLVVDSDYTDNDVDNLTPYYYVVRAVDANSNESGNSNEATATPDYQDCNDVKNGGYRYLSDINGDCHVNSVDLGVIADYWLNTNCAGLGNCDNADLEPDGDVDLLDFSDFAIDWLRCNDPEDEDCTPNWPGPA